MTFMIYVSLQQQYPATQLFTVPLNEITSRPALIIRHEAYDQENRSPFESEAGPTFINSDTPTKMEWK
ncbi:3588_t:CDS:2 [Funneliformis geosporum]|nr:3588_t:CDS:2 [Funneliformis geosporum]